MHHLQFGIPHSTEKYIKFVSKSRIKEILVLAPFEKGYLEPFKDFNPRVNTKANDTLLWQINDGIVDSFNAFQTKLKEDDSFLSSTKANLVYKSFVQHYKLRISSFFQDETGLMNTAEIVANSVGLKSIPSLSDKKPSVTVPKDAESEELDMNMAEQDMNMESLVSHIILPSMDSYIMSLIHIIQLEMSLNPEHYKILIFFPTSSISALFRVLVNHVLGITDVLEHHIGSTKQSALEFQKARKVIMFTIGFIGRGKGDEDSLGFHLLSSSHIAFTFNSFQICWEPTMTWMR